MEWAPASLGIVLSRLKGFSHVTHRLEQYVTPSELAGQFLYAARFDLKGKKVMDLGAGTGILGIGAGLIGSTVTFVEIDEEAKVVLCENLDAVSSEYGSFVHTIVRGDVTRVTLPSVDTVIMNPPFGTKQKGIDARFLEKAFSCASVVWSMHKSSTMEFIETFSEKHGFSLAFREDVEFSIPKTHELHAKRREFISVSMVCLRKKE